MDATDYEKVANIYQQGIDSKQCTFETEVPTWEILIKDIFSIRD